MPEKITDLLHEARRPVSAINEEQRQRVLADTYLKSIDLMKGNVAMCIYHYRDCWPADKYVEDLRGASGNRALAIALSAIRGLWPRANLRSDVIGATGDQALAIVRCAEEGLWPYETLREDVLGAAGSTDRAIVQAHIAGLWPEDKLRADLMGGSYDAWVLYIARKNNAWPEDTYRADVLGAHTGRAMAVVFSRKHGFWPVDSFPQDLWVETGEDREQAVSMAKRLGLLPDEDTGSDA